MRHFIGKTRLPLLLVAALIALLSTFSGCSHKVGPTTVHVVDSVRHYYPIALEQKIQITALVENTGNEPLIINDIQPSCGCIIFDSKPDMVILPGDSKRYKFIFNASKNIGFVHYFIRFYANTPPKGIFSLEFDIIIVAPSENTPDYEEVYREQLKNGEVQDIYGHVVPENPSYDYYVDSNGKNKNKNRMENKPF